MDRGARLRVAEPDDAGGGRDDPPKEPLEREVLDSLIEGCQVIDPAFRYVFVNEAVCRQGRRSREELLGRTMMACYPGIEATPVFAALRECMESRTPRRMENEFTFPDGAVGWFELRMQPVPQGVCILSVEITEQKRAGLRIENLNAALRGVQRVNQLIVRERDPHVLARRTCEVLVESRGFPTACLILGAPRPTYVASAGRHTGTLPDRILATGAPGCVRDALAGNGPLVRRRGTEACTDCPFADASCASWDSATVRLENAGTTYGALLVSLPTGMAPERDEMELLQEVAEDVAFALRGIEADERRLEVEAEIESLARFPRENPGPVLRLTRSGARIVFANPASEALLAHWGRGVGDAPPPELREAIAQALADGKRRQIDVAVGGTTHYMLTVAPVPDADYVNVYGSDVTVLRRTEEQLIAAQRLEAVGRLAGGIAHDFNNLLSVIISHSEFVIGGLADGAAPREDVVAIQRAARRAAALTSQLLAFSRRQVLAPAVLDLNQVITDTEDMLRRLIGEDVVLTTALASDLGSVTADRGQLEQVLMNLAVNSRDAMPEGGRLTIETANVELDADYAARHVATAPGRYVRLAVSDTGTGMDTATRERIFEPFFTTKEPNKGTGLGLSTVYGIVKQSGGNIWAYSEPGLGTAIKIYLPRTDAAPEPARASPIPPLPAKGPITILLVEDDDAVRKATRRILGIAGYFVLATASGPEALEVSDQHEGAIDLVLTDVVMPHMSGRAFADEIRVRRPGVPILFMSGYTDNAIVHHGILDAGTNFISKPFGSADLTAKIAEVLGRS